MYYGLESEIFLICKENELMANKINVIHNRKKYFTKVIKILDKRGKAA